MKNTTKSGMAAVTALAVIILLLTLSMGVAGLSMNSMRRSRQDTTAWLALQAARAGLEHQIALCNQELGNSKAVFSATKKNLSADLDEISEGAKVTTEVTPLTNNKMAYITSTATLRGITKSVRSYCTAEYFSIWNNVIFAGGGGSGSINGNTTMKGSVHILGTGEPYSDLNSNSNHDTGEKFTDKNGNGVWDPGETFVDANKDGVCNVEEPYDDLNGNGAYDAPLTSVTPANDMGGNAGIGNNYSGMPAGLRSEIVDPPKVGGLETLNAVLRVRRGSVNLSGASTVGAGGTESGGKGPMDGVFVNDGFTGKGTSAVYSDNGAANKYDMEGLNLQYPYISGIGAKSYVGPNGSTWTTHEKYLDASALTVPVVKIDTAQGAFSYSDAKGNSISYVPPIPKKTMYGLLTVNGLVKIAGNLSIGAKDTIRYAGRGTIYSTNNIYIDGNFRPLAGLKFPRDTAVGLIAKKDMLIATGSGSSQLTMAGAFYAQARIVSAKQNNIAGTFVASTYDMKNVPAIFQVPSLVDYMPPAMPGDGVKAKINVGSWRMR